jgi:glutathione S-transferase
MSDLTLVIGNKAYSSWSLRPWLLLRESGIPFHEISIPLYQPDSPRRIREHSPSGRVPALIDGAITIWDSLAICEYVAERFPDARRQPGADDASHRAVVVRRDALASRRCAASPMNLRGRRAG